MLTRIGLVVVSLHLMIGSAHGATITLNGYLDVSTNAALIASDGYQDFQTARFANNDEIARNVALYAFTVTTAGTFEFDSVGWAAGGAEPFFTIFAGAGTAATFLDSNFFIPAIDFNLSRTLAVGNYMLALGVWQNLSFAENNPDLDPTLGDAFTALGDPGRLGNAYYELGISSDDGVGEVGPSGVVPPRPTPVPEPSSMLLLGAGLAGLMSPARKRMSQRRYSSTALQCPHEGANP